MVTGSAPWNNSGNDCSKVIDGRNDIYFDGVANGWVQIDLGKKYSITGIGFAPREKYEFRCVDAVISGSTDGVNWPELYTVNDLCLLRKELIKQE